MGVIRFSGPAFMVTILAATLIGLSACTTDYVCNTILIRAIKVTVVDSVTGAPAAAGAKLVLKQNSVPIDSSSTTSDVDDLYVGWSSGTYDLVLTRAGYVTWTRNGVKVASANRCRQPETVSIAARLQRAP